MTLQSNKQSEPQMNKISTNAIFYSYQLWHPSIDQYFFPLEASLFDKNILFEVAEDELGSDQVTLDARIKPLFFSLLIIIVFRMICAQIHCPYQGTKISILEESRQNLNDDSIPTVKTFITHQDNEGETFCLRLRFGQIIGEPIENIQTISKIFEAICLDISNPNYSFTISLILFCLQKWLLLYGLLTQDNTSLSEICCMVCLIDKDVYD